MAPRTDAGQHFTGPDVMQRRIAKATSKARLWCFGAGWARPQAQSSAGVIPHPAPSNRGSGARVGVSLNEADGPKRSRKCPAGPVPLSDRPCEGGAKEMLFKTMQHHPFLDFAATPAPKTRPGDAQTEKEAIAAAAHGRIGDVAQQSAITRCIPASRARRWYRAGGTTLSRSPSNHTGGQRSRFRSMLQKRVVTLGQQRRRLHLAGQTQRR
jgi:hypothetical protein